MQINIAVSGEFYGLNTEPQWQASSNPSLTELQIVFHMAKCWEEKKKKPFPYRIAM